MLDDGVVPTELKVSLLLNRAENRLSMSKLKVSVFEETEFDRSECPASPQVSMSFDSRRGAVISTVFTGGDTFEQWRERDEDDGQNGDHRRTVNAAIL